MKKPDEVRPPNGKPNQHIQTNTIAGLGTAEKAAQQSQAEGGGYKDGIFGGESTDAKPQFVKQPSEKVIDSMYNAQIVMGPYKPRGQVSKQMAQGQRGVATIDLVVGRMGSYAKSYEDDDSIEDLRKEVRIAEAHLAALSGVTSTVDPATGMAGLATRNMIGPDGLELGQGAYADVDDINSEKIKAYNEAFNKYSFAKSKLDEKVNPGKHKRIYTNNNYKVDSARIVICQRGDADHSFGLRPGRVGASRSRSFVALKGDDVRIIARESIKLVTGTDDENSQGGKLEVPRGIDLIGANDDKDMQPLLKGTNVLECLDDMNDNISALNGIVMDFLTQQLVFNTAMGFHIHIDPFTAVTGPSPSAIAAWATDFGMKLGTTFGSVVANKINLGVTYFKYLVPKPFLGDKFICSKYNHTN